MPMLGSPTRSRGKKRRERRSGKMSPSQPKHLDWKLKCVLVLVTGRKRRAARHMHLLLFLHTQAIRQAVGDGGG